MRNIRTAATSAPVQALSPRRRVPALQGSEPVADVVYRIVEHDGGWAYKVGDVFSETFPTRGQAEAVAERVAAEQTVPGETEAIEWQDESGQWHDETASGSERPRAYVERRSDPRPELAEPRARPFRITHLLLAGTAGALVAILITRRRSPA